MNAQQRVDVGVVVIGRNEGERLERCLTSLLNQGAAPIVYVDSGSTDGSVEMAEARGVVVVNLDTKRPFTMARGRNAGFRRLLQLPSPPELVQFVDGDCEVDEAWLARGRALLDERQDVVAVCGFRRERFPGASIYNRLADMEWRGPTGEIQACGGDAMYRLTALRRVDGFDESMIAGEEAELCSRLRRTGGKIWRLDCPMTLHDAAMHHFNQWWRRSVRTGHAYAEGHSLTGNPGQRRQWMSALTYGVVIPGGTLLCLMSPVGTVVKGLPLLAATAAYAKSAYGAYAARRRLQDAPADAALYAGFCVAGKAPEAQGVLKFWINRVRGTRSGLIEYKK